MSALTVKQGSRYRPATRDEVLEAAAQYLVEEQRGQSITASMDAVRIARHLIGGREHETFAALWLDTRHRLIAAEPMFRGTIDGATVYAREVAKRALELNAAAVAPRVRIVVASQ